MNARPLAGEVERLDAMHVLHGRRLRGDVTMSETARYSDTHWALTPATVQGHQRGLTLHFDTVPERYQLALKRLIYVALSGPLPSSERRMAIPSVATLFYDSRAFLLWLDNSRDGIALSRVSADTLLSYQRELLAEYREHSRRHALRGAVSFFWRYRKGLDDEGALPLDPRRLPGWHEPRGRRGENTTARIPEEVQSRLLVWALRFVDEFADDIISAVERWAQLRDKASRVRRPYGTSQDMISKYLKSCHEHHRPLPGIDGLPNYLAIARLLGCDPLTVRQHAALVEAAVSTLGVSEYTYLNVSIHGQLDGHPWIPGVAVRTNSEHSVTVLTQVLQAACYVVVAFLSGMRDGEIKHLRPGCCTVEADGNGRPYRWKVASLAFKGEDSDVGVPATWIIGEPGARAMTVLERLHRAASREPTDWLFGPIAVGPGAGSSGRTGNVALTSASTNAQLNRLIAWVNDYCAAVGRNDAIPDVDGAPWRLSTRQFRRTLAWYIARRPGGSIAGAIAYRHHSIQMFEGYAGTSDSGFRAEVEAEQALARGEHLLAMIDQHQHNNLIGPAADEAERRLNAMAEHPAFAGTVTTDRHRFQRLLTLHGPAVYPGKYVTCVYTHARALCRPDGGANETPDQANCKPLTCRNVALTTENIQTWRGELEQIERELTGPPPLPPAVAGLLEQRRLRIVEFLTNHEEKS